MLENLSTHERVRVTDLAAVGPQIECWLARLAPPAGASVVARDEVPGAHELLVAPVSP